MYLHDKLTCTYVHVKPKIALLNIVAPPGSHPHIRSILTKSMLQTFHLDPILEVLYEEVGLWVEWWWSLPPLNLSCTYVHDNFSQGVIDYSLNHFCHSSTLLLWMNNNNMKADQSTGSRNGMILGIQYLSAASLCQVTTELTPLSLCKFGRSRALTTSLIYYFAYFSVELRNKQYKLFREKQLYKFTIIGKMPTQSYSR